MQKMVNVGIKYFFLQVSKYFFHYPFFNFVHKCYIRFQHAVFVNSYVDKRSAAKLGALHIVINSIIETIAYFYCPNICFTSLYMYIYIYIYIYIHIYAYIYWQFIIFLQKFYYFNQMKHGLVFFSSELTQDKLPLEKTVIYHCKQPQGTRNTVY